MKFDKVSMAMNTLPLTALYQSAFIVPLVMIIYALIEGEVFRWRRDQITDGGVKEEW